MDEKILAQELGKALAPFLGQKASGTPTATAPIYGTGGLFGACDGPKQLINAMVGPIGIESVLNFYGTDTEREHVDTLTDIVESGSEPTTSCGQCVTVSNRACEQFYCFGRFCRATEETAFDEVGVRATAATPKRVLMGAITDAAGNVLMPNGARIDDVFYLQARSAGFALRYLNSTLMWSGNPANNNNKYMEYIGLQLLVNTGKYDSRTMAYCDAIDSKLMNYAYQNPTATGTYAIQNWFRSMILYFMRRAGGANFDWNTATMYIAMSEDLWDCVSRVFACNGADLCNLSGSTDAEVTISADAALSRYHQFQQDMALPILGKLYPVVLDSQIPQSTGQPNGVCSDIYFLVTDIGGEEVLYGQYQDFNMTYGRVRNEFISMFGSDDIAITDNGRYAVVRDNERGCFDIQVYTKPRLVALTPWLLGRIQNVCCQLNTSSGPYPDPSLQGSIYSPSGGRATSPVPTLYGSCDSTLS